MDAAFHSRNLPHSVEAIIDDADTHRKFLETFANEGVTASSHPLVRFDPQNHVEPFKLMSGK